MPTVKEIASRIENGERIYLLDVRRGREYADYHISGSINLPYDYISDIGRVVKDKNAEIYVFCATGRYSKNAQTVLNYMGYANVCDLGRMDT